MGKPLASARRLDRDTEDLSAAEFIARCGFAISRSTLESLAFDVEAEIESGAIVRIRPGRFIPAAWLKNRPRGGVVRFSSSPKLGGDS